MKLTDNPNFIYFLLKITKKGGLKRVEKIMGFIYQYIVLIAVIGLLIISYLKAGEFNDILLGALVGVMVQLPNSQQKEKRRNE